MNIRLIANYFLRLGKKKENKKLKIHFPAITKIYVTEEYIIRRKR